MRKCDICMFVFSDDNLELNPATQNYVCRFCDVKKRIEQGREVSRQALDMLWSSL